MTIFLLFLVLQSPADIFKSANADMDAGRYADAAAKFEQILKDDPTHIPSEFDLAVCYTKLGKPEAARTLYSTIIGQDSEIYEARFNLAILLEESGNDPAADEQFQKAAALRPKDSRPLLFHAGFLEKTGHPKEAAEAYDRAAQDSSNPDARRAAVDFYIRRANELHAQKAELESAESFEKALTLDPGRTDLLRRIGVAYRLAGNFDKAIAVLERLGSTNNVDLAATYFEKKDFQKAASAFELVVQANPDNSDYRYLLGKCQMELKQYPQAVSTFQEALKLKPDDTDTLSSLASTYQLLAEWANAARTIERFIQFKPRDAYAYFMLATSYDRLQNAKLALVNYNKFLELDDGSNDVRSFQVRERAKTLERRLKNPQ